MKDPKRAGKFRAMSEALEPKIAHLSRPMTQNPTPKRNKEYQSRLLEARNLERLQRALVALADHHETGSVPESLAALKSKDEIARMVRKGVDGSRGGHYSVIEAADYNDTTPAGRLLQGLLEGNSPQNEARERDRRYGELLAEIALCTFPGYFPTPEPTAIELAQIAEIEAGMRILEPNAGSGNLIRAIQSITPDVKIQTIEPVPKLAASLRYLPNMDEDGAVLESDFLSIQPSQLGRFDRIVMNPPFEKGADIRHILHALKFLEPGGILVALCANGARQNEKLRPMVEELHGEWKVLPAGSFKSSGTGVSVARLVIRTKAIAISRELSAEPIAPVELPPIHLLTPASQPKQLSLF